ncbi:MAG: undecaprenyl/decaprenyl-phosphate alpha-N-acetylglucosaminyl 1-phosphate transferase, partial [Actinobacteria bacterium]|nr:undecaprenyl/decaprenyl-phosphate alpha-N-acetylglucosaminyl 1-phosphate transferase [Actinomycetota bacterium]
MTAYLFVGVVAFVVAFVATPLVCKLATRVGAIDHPNDRKVHALPTPTLGGLAIFLGILVAGGVASFMPEFDAVFIQSAQPLG